MVEEDKSIIIYWELQGDSFTERAGEAITVRYKANDDWSHPYSGRTDQIQISLGENDGGRWLVRIMHDGRTLNPPYTDGIKISYSVSKLR